MNLFDLPAAEELVSALFVMLFCGLIGVEREVRRKDAGIRTHILVGLGSYLFTLVSLYGVPEMLTGNLRWDASRIASQIVSGIGFIGAGVIFFEHDSVRGLTTASAIWVAAAIGMACGVGMITIAGLVVVLYFIVILAVAPLVRHLLHRGSDGTLRITYLDGCGVLRSLLLEATGRGFETMVTASRQVDRGGRKDVVVDLHVTGGKDVPELVTALSMLDGVVGVELLEDPER
ncbi:MgtC/SapB family protein [Actinobaculum sp. 352]|uniref:MgtC/SapB family protein n=1 Tax=Actinobaculum sp. 352 TaxID=2490946 RepID=UPI000F7E1C6A|nr:MgtC/SapB family protein [Actinobaculum sp. 352]RTE48012.1 MgtC/SapB family protein [Actinobaculum sp. 352]